MQTSQFYRRGVVRPLDDCAAEQLAGFRIDTPIRTEWVPVLSDQQFAELWEAGVFQSINEACGITISDYEEVELTADKIGLALNAIHGASHLEGSVAEFFQCLERLLKDAMEARKHVYFIF